MTVRRFQQQEVVRSYCCPSISDDSSFQHNVIAKTYYCGNFWGLELPTTRFYHPCLWADTRTGHAQGPWKMHRKSYTNHRMIKYNKAGTICFVMHLLFSFPMILFWRNLRNVSMELKRAKHIKSGNHNVIIDNALKFILFRQQE